MNTIVRVQSRGPTHAGSIEKEKAGDQANHENEQRYAAYGNHEIEHV